MPVVSLKSLMSVSFAIFAALGAPSARAGQHVGNGGDAVVCRQAGGAILSVEAFDVYEAKALRGFEIDLGEGRDPYALAKLGFERLVQLDLWRMIRFQKQVDEFAGEARFVPNVTLIDVPDAGNVPFQPGCKLEQLAIQHEPEFPGDKRYLVSQDLWEKLPVAHQAALIMHEIIYRYALENEHEDSRRARYFNSILFSRQIESLTATDYARLVNRLYLPETSYRDEEGAANWHYVPISLDSAAGSAFCRAHGMRIATPSDYSAQRLDIVNYHDHFRQLIRGFGHANVVLNTNRPEVTIIVSDYPENFTMPDKPSRPAPRPFICISQER